VTVVSGSELPRLLWLLLPLRKDGLMSDQKIQDGGPVPPKNRFLLLICVLDT
jgi:hypothetical protein